jgi:hypothetical protein
MVLLGEDHVASLVGENLIFLGELVTKR